jgi:hypothetical protein
MVNHNTPLYINLNEEEQRLGTNIQVPRAKLPLLILLTDNEFPRTVNPSIPFIIAVFGVSGTPSALAS